MLYLLLFIIHECKRPIQMSTIKNVGPACG